MGLLSLLIVNGILLQTGAKVVSPPLVNDPELVSDPEHGVEKRSSVCYDDLGCYSTGTPFWSLQRPINFLPQRPEKVNTRFFLYTRTHPSHYTQLNANDYNSIRSSHFDAAKKTKIISHGFLENGFVTWMKDMKDAFLKVGDFNVILVDWGGGSSFPYTQATANTRLVGAEIAKLISVLQKIVSVDPTTIHIIGHSLGAHIAGYAGEKTPNLGRISGLDPAGPYFENTDKVVRLDPTDAMFVDCIHSDAESLIPNVGFGMKQAIGHVDYYPNGGKDQPGCGSSPLTQVLLKGDLYEGGKQFVACNHLRAYEYFTESINSACPFEGYSCDSYGHFLDGTCTLCTGNLCGKMGYHADQAKPTRGKTGIHYYLMTSTRSPYCQYHYFVRISIANVRGAREWRGQILANIHGDNGQLGQRVLNQDYQYFEPGKSYAFVLSAPHDLGHIHDVSLLWKHHGFSINPLQWNPFNLRNPSLNFQRVQVVAGESHQKVTFCDSGSTPNNKLKTVSRTC